MMTGWQVYVVFEWSVTELRKRTRMLCSTIFQARGLNIKTGAALMGGTSAKQLNAL